MAQVAQSVSNNSRGFAGSSPVSSALNALLADSFTLYLKTKNLHWRVRGPQFRPYHLVLDEHAEELFTSTDDLARRVREVGGCVAVPGGELGRIRERSRFTRPEDMLGELKDDNDSMMQAMREAHALCRHYADKESENLLDTLIDQAARRSGFLCEISQDEEDGVY